ncbi:hypothetical protein K440DRAFT_280594 [Wilcoxina mikolae CBS 423.85]|nr:hypothetical protein K440DRAFT_280594 [Wilcoxina mikolae CBS 423.85]
MDPLTWTNHTEGGKEIHRVFAGPPLSTVLISPARTTIPKTKGALTDNNVSTFTYIVRNVKASIGKDLVDSTFRPRTGASLVLARNWPLRWREISDVPEIDAGVWRVLEHPPHSQHQHYEPKLYLPYELPPLPERSMDLSKPTLEQRSPKRRLGGKGSTWGRRPPNPPHQPPLLG